MSRGHLSLSGETSVPVFPSLTSYILPHQNGKTRLLSDNIRSSACQVSHTGLRMIVHHSMCACHLHSACPRGGREQESLLHAKMLHARVTTNLPSRWAPDIFPLTFVPAANRHQAEVAVRRTNCLRCHGLFKKIGRNSAPGVSVGLLYVPRKRQVIGHRYYEQVIKPFPDIYQQCWSQWCCWHACLYAEFDLCRSCVSTCFALKGFARVCVCVCMYVYIIYIHVMVMVMVRASQIGRQMQANAGT